MKKLFSAIVFSALAVLSINVSVAAPAPAQATTTEKLDINTATEQQLTTLSGVGEARAKDLIKGRPYKAKDDLVKNKSFPSRSMTRSKTRLLPSRSDSAIK